jgi:putative ABC transport system permease protein
MIRSYFLLAFRGFKKNKVHALINMLGLSLGLTASILAFMFVLDERSFDHFHENKARLYRLNKVNMEGDGSTSLTAETSGMMGPTMAEEFAEVDKVVRFQPWYDDIVLSYADKDVFTREQEIVFVDSTFFETFSFRLIRGDKKNVLARPSTIVLTEKTASALFGSEDPIGKTVTAIQGLPFEVTGIAADPPRNSHIQFRGLISWSSTVPQVGPLPFAFMNNWIAQAISTYVLLKPGAAVADLERKFPRFMKDHLPERVDKYSLYLQPFQDVYLESYNIQALRMAKVGNEQFVFLFSVIAGFILFIACVNYVNISTSKATRKAREVGMRKTLGAGKTQLVQQFLGESFLLTLLSSIIAVLMLYLLIPFFNEIAGKSIPLTLLLEPAILSAIIGLVMCVSIASGIYPSLVISSFRPAEVLKMSGKSKLAGNWPRYVLITVQFVISITMIAGTMLVYKQIRFILSKDLGFDKEHVVVVNLTDNMMNHGAIFQNDVNGLPGVVNTTLCRTALGSGIPSTYIVPEGFPPDQIEIRMFPADPDFQKTYGLRLKMGRFLDWNIASDSNAFVINEALMKKLGWEDPTKKTIRFAEDQPAMPVIGVLEDFHFKSLYEEVEPIVVWISPNNRRNLSIRFTGDPGQLLGKLDSKWKMYESKYPFQYYFVDEEFAKTYQAEGKLFKTVMTFAGVSIFIACLGLYGLVSYTIEQRTKEFGIRRVFGASLTSLNILVNRKFIFMVLFASAIAIPVVIPVVNKWLSKFAFKITIGPGVFILSIAITLLITVLAVSIQAIRVARMNPAHSLRHE